MPFMLCLRIMLTFPEKNCSEQVQQQYPLHGNKTYIILDRDKIPFPVPD